MFVTPNILLNAVAAAGTSNPVACPPEINQWPMGVEVFGTFVGTVVLEGTIATQAEVNALTATWLPITGASWTTPALAQVTAPFSHIRANVTSYTSGNISVRAY